MSGVRVACAFALCLLLVGCTRHEDHVQSFGVVRLEHTVTWTVPLPVRHASLVTVRTPTLAYQPEGITRPAAYEELVGIFAGGSYSDPAGPERSLVVLDTRTGKAVLGGAECEGKAAPQLGVVLAYRNQAPQLMSMVDAFERDAVVLRNEPASSRVLTQLQRRAGGWRCVDFPLHPGFPSLVHVESLRSGDLTVGACPDDTGDKSKCVHLWLRVGEPAKVVSESDVVALRVAPARQ